MAIVVEGALGDGVEDVCALLRIVPADCVVPPAAGSSVNAAADVPESCGGTFNLAWGGATRGRG